MKRDPRSVRSVRLARLIVDVMNEALAGALARPGRAMMTALGTVLGVGALIATLGIAQTAGGQILATFDELVATEILIFPREEVGQSEGTLNAIPADAESRLERLNGVVAAGTLAKLALSTGPVSTLVSDPRQDDGADPPVVAASPGLLGSVRGEMRTGRWFTLWHEQNAARVAVLGSAAAASLNIFRVDNQPTIFLNDEAYVVVGILESVARENDLLNSAIIPQGTAIARYGLEAPDRVVVETQLGATQLIGRQVALALAPTAPDALVVEVPPDLQRLRGNTERQVNALLVLLSVVTLIVGAVGIANVTLVAVFERSGEIGLRRALGATRKQVVTQFLFESTVLGVLGGLVGSSAGLITLLITAAVRDWTPILDQRLLVLGPLLGALVGLASGAYPAWRAGRIEPADAVRVGVG